MKIKSSSIGLAGLMKKTNEAGPTTTNVLKRTVIDQTQLSIFKKARLNTNSRFMAVGSSERVLQSGFKAFDSSSNMVPSTSTTTTKKIKRLAPLAQD